MLVFLILSAVFTNEIFCLIHGNSSCKVGTEDGWSTLGVSIPLFVSFPNAYMSLCHHISPQEWHQSALWHFLACVKDLCWLNRYLGVPTKPQGEHYTHFIDVNWGWGFHKVSQQTSSAVKFQLSPSSPNRSMFIQDCKLAFINASSLITDSQHNAVLELCCISMNTSSMTVELKSTQLRLSPGIRIPSNLSFPKLPWRDFFHMAVLY